MHRVCSPAVRGITVPGGAHKRVSSYANDVSTFASSCSDIEVVLKVLERYENATWSKINSDNSSSLRLDAC